MSVSLATEYSSEDQGIHSHFHRTAAARVFGVVACVLTARQAVRVNAVLSMAGWLVSVRIRTPACADWRVVT
jgi:hypothetical protein